MRAVLCRELGPPENLTVEEVPDPEPGEDQVRIRIEAAGVNYADGLMVRGGYQIKMPLPFTPGMELAGTVDAVGAGVDAPVVGDRVMAMGFGAFAEKVVVDASSVRAVPASLSAVTAASITQSYGTGLFALDRRAQLMPGEILLVLGGGGGVGAAAIDLGVALGARVIGAASTEEKRQGCLDAGASAVIDYTTEDLKERARELSDGGVDVVYDPVGGDLAEPALRALRDFGRYLVIGFAAGSIPQLPSNQILLRNRSVVGVDWGAWAMGNAADGAALMAELLAMVADGRLAPAQPTEYPLEQAGQVLADLHGRRLVGKAVLVP
jgi:NADPH2:quinone reductase